MKKFNPSMFDSIKGALSNQEQRTSLSNILQMEAGNTYTVRLLPDMEKPDKTLFHYFYLCLCVLVALIIILAWQELLFGVMVI